MPQPSEETILANPQAEMDLIISGADPGRSEAWVRWKAYDANWYAARKSNLVPWIGTIEVYGWSPYFNMLNQRAQGISALGNQWILPTPSQLAKLVS